MLPAVKIIKLRSGIIFCQAKEKAPKLTNDLRLSIGSNLDFRSIAPEKISIQRILKVSFFLPSEKKGYHP